MKVIITHVPFYIIWRVTQDMDEEFEMVFQASGPLHVIPYYSVRRTLCWDVYEEIGEEGITG